ncbi:MAG: hypothetical protein AB1420_15915 [Bacillota bacterium]
MSKSSKTFSIETEILYRMEKAVSEKEMNKFVEEAIQEKLERMEKKRG